MAQQPVSHNVHIPTSAHHRVLIVDDESAILFAYRKLIEPQGFDVDTCENIYEAMALVRTRPYLAIITDMRFEGTDNEDGIELIRFIREMQPDAGIIVSTGYGNEELKRTTRAMGAVRYFEKPLEPSAILTFLKELSSPELSDLCLESGIHC
jgi:DNA-binding NtrC family response regulator